eukprot:4742945-Pleurochrysis_carterae.AAC.1
MFQIAPDLFQIVLGPLNVCMLSERDSPNLLVFAGELVKLISRALCGALRSTVRASAGHRCRSRQIAPRFVRSPRVSSDRSAFCQVVMRFVRSLCVSLDRYVSH